MIKTIRVFDLDGVLADSSHRYKLGLNGKIDLAHWRLNSDKVYLDSVLPTASIYQEGLQNDSVATVIATARVWCEQSTKWLSDHIGHPDSLIHRLGDDDARGGALLKLQGLAPILGAPEHSQVERIEVFEDNINYLKTLCDALPNAIGYYIPSGQGH